MRTRPVSLLALAALLACGGAEKKDTLDKEGAVTRGPSPLLSDAVAGVEHPALKELLTEHWEWLMTERPVWATTLGDHRYDHRIGDNSVEAHEARKAMRRSWLSRLGALPVDELSPMERTTVALFIEDLEADIASEVCAFEQWNLSAYSTPVSRWNLLPDQHRIESAEDGQNYLARVRAIPKAIDNEVAHLRLGVKAGKVTNAETARRVVALVKGVLAKPTAEWPLLRPAREARPAWTDAQRKAFDEELLSLVETGVRPAVSRYAAFVESEILPRARGEDASGLGALPGGDACYAARIAAHTGLDLSAKEIHDIGLAEVRSINDEMRSLGKKLFGTDDLAAILKKLRTDEDLYFRTPEEVQAKAEAALRVAKARMGDFFGILPKADCVVVPIPDYEAPYTTIAYYRAPHYDGSKPGEYFINTYQPETRPRYEAEALAYHESIPGHHLQIAIAQELPAMPMIRKQLGTTAFVEGWALYTERLSNEMGLYSGDLDRMGMLSYDAWRASRLVVDTGIHALGWSREQAVQFMLEHTALAENNIRNEVDRYISWPGQALAYKLGQREILRLRRWARDELGDRFDIKGFHDAVLGGGPVSLKVLGEQVKEWVDRTKASAPAAEASRKE